MMKVFCSNPQFFVLKNLGSTPCQRFLIYEIGLALLTINNFVDFIPYLKGILQFIDVFYFMWCLIQSISCYFITESVFFLRWTTLCCLRQDLLKNFSFQKAFFHPEIYSLTTRKTIYFYSFFHLSCSMRLLSVAVHALCTLFLANMKKSCRSKYMKAIIVMVLGA